jgi:hypothetical protein
VFSKVLSATEQSTEHFAIWDAAEGGIEIKTPNPH